MSAPDTLQLRIGGMHCASCVARVESALARVPGVSEASVNLATGRATLALEGEVEFARLAAAVRAAGYEAKPAAGAADDDEEKRERAAELDTLRRRFTVAAALSAPVFLLGMFGMLPAVQRLIPMATQNAIQLVLAIPVQFYAGWPFVRGAWLGMVRRIPDMNLLVGVGTLAAFFYSAAATLAPGAFRAAGAEPLTYFDTAVVIVTLILLGRLLEARAKAGTSAAIRKLMELRPAVAHRVVNGETREVDVADIAPDDVLLVRPGERVPVDGVVLDGRSTLDASLLTGESMPIEAAPGTHVSGGTLNQTGAFRMRATRVGADSALMRIVRLVQQAQGSKAQVARLADRIAAVFVPVVIGIAVVTIALWWWLGPEPRLVHAMLAGVAVLIIACPCALGLATPTALMAGTGRGAELGVLVRGAESLESAHAIDTIVFDKTGTLTRGRPQVADVVPAPGVTLDVLLAAAAAVEGRSEHPLAFAIVRAARERGIAFPEPDDFSAVPGRGAIALVEGRAVMAGTLAFLAEQGADVGALAADAARLEEAGHTVIAIASGGETLGLIALGDTLKPDAAEAVARLTREGYAIWLMSGDNARTASAVAAAAGIAADHVLAPVLPGEKAAKIAELQARGLRVAMVGDGLNDAPALAKADLGIAIGGGADIAMETADMTLVRGDLAGVRTALALARETLRIIRQNLFWAFVYNTLGIPVAAGLLYVALRPGGPVGPVMGWDGTLHPMLASAAMALSSVSVVTNSLRLRRFNAR